MLESLPQEFNVYATGYFRNPNYTELLQFISAFTFGVIFSPFSYGAVFLIVFLVLYEFAYAYYTQTCLPYWRLSFRVGIFMTAIFGWILGRTIVGWRNPLQVDPNVP